MQTNNELYKTICENMNIPVEQGVHNNNYYLKQIATVGYGKVYTGTVCNGILIKDIAEAITESTYTGHHFTNFYLKEIASALTGDDYNTEFDNYYLNIWAENIAPKNPSNLIWQVPPSDMEYGDFNATGLLTGENNTPIADATVYLVVGSTKVSNAQTNSNGVVTFTGSPVHTGTHSFKLVFEGNTDYANSESSTVTITVSKESTYLNLTEHTTIGYTDGNIRFAGQLLDNDSPSHFVVGKSIKLMNAHTQEVYDTVETDSSGRFVSEFNISTSGTYIIVAFFEGDNDYNASGQSCDNTVINDPSLNLVADKPILSYADEQQTAGSQVCTVTATVNSGVSQEGEVMSFTVKNSGGTVVETGSAIVDSSNQCEYEYVSKGLGDVTVEAEATVSGILVSKTYTLEDCNYYSDSYTKIKSDCTSNVISDRTLYSMSSNYQSDVELTFKLKDNMPSAFGVGFGDGQNIKVKMMPFKVSVYNRRWHIYYSTNTKDNAMDDGGSVLSSSTVDSVFKLRTKNLHKIYLYVDDVPVAYRDTNTNYPLNIRIDDFTASPLNLEYLKVKPL